MICNILYYADIFASHRVIGLKGVLTKMSEKLEALLALKMERIHFPLFSDLGGLFRSHCQ